MFDYDQWMSTKIVGDVLGSSRPYGKRAATHFDQFIQYHNKDTNICLQIRDVGSTSYSYYLNLWEFLNILLASQRSSIRRITKLQFIMCSFPVDLQFIDTLKEFIRVSSIDTLELNNIVVIYDRLPKDSCVFCNAIITEVIGLNHFHRLSINGLVMHGNKDWNGRELKEHERRVKNNTVFNDQRLTSLTSLEIMDDFIDDKMIFPFIARQELLTELILYAQHINPATRTVFENMHFSNITHLTFHNIGFGIQQPDAQLNDILQFIRKCPKLYALMIKRSECYDWREFLSKIFEIKSLRVLEFTDVGRTSESTFQYLLKINKQRLLYLHTIGFYKTRWLYDNITDEDREFLNASLQKMQGMQVKKMMAILSVKEVPTAVNRRSALKKLPKDLVRFMASFEN